MLQSTSPITIVGAGALGQALGQALVAAGRTVAGVVSRSPSRGGTLAQELDTRWLDTVDAISGPVTILCVPDDRIREVASVLPIQPGGLVVHCAGSRGLEVLDDVKAAGGLRGSLHPVMVFSPSGRGGEALRGATAAVDGDQASRSWLHELALDLGMHPVEIPDDRRALYHLSASLVGGLMTGLLAAAADLWSSLGLDRNTGAAALAPMVREAGRNLEDLGIPAVVMGPAVRGDIGTLQRHLDQLETLAPHLLPLYRELVLLNLPYAVEDHRLDPRTAEDVRRLMRQNADVTHHPRE